MKSSHFDLYYLYSNTKFNQKDIENNIQVIKEYNQLGENTRGFLYEMQLQIGQRKIAGIMKETVEFDLQNNKIGG